MERLHFDFIHWQQDYACGIDKLDVYRQKLLDIYNMMIERYNAHTCKDNIAMPFFKLSFVAESYFYDLEIMLRQLEYPEFGRKKLRYKEIRNRIVQFKEDFTAQKDTVCQDMLVFMSDWLAKEILILDEHVMLFLKERGVA